MKTVVTINKPMFANIYKFDMTKLEFMERYDNQITAVGYFTDETVDGLTLVVNPSHCGFIEIYEVSE